MMINKKHNAGSTEEGFMRYLKRQEIIFGVYIAIGIAVLVWMNTAGAALKQQDYTDGFLWGLSVALIAIGAIRLIRTVHCIKDPGKFQKAYTEYTDERNQFVLMKTYQTAAYIFIMALALATIVTSFISTVITSALAACIGVFALILTITYRIMSKIY